MTTKSTVMKKIEDASCDRAWEVVGQLKPHTEDPGLRQCIEKDYRLGAIFGYRLAIEELRSDDAKAQKHCNELIQKMFGQTPAVLAYWLEGKLK